MKDTTRRDVGFGFDNTLDLRGTDPHRLFLGSSLFLSLSFSLFGLISSNVYRLPTELRCIYHTARDYVSGRLRCLGLPADAAWYRVFSYVYLRFNLLSCHTRVVLSELNTNLQFYSSQRHELSLFLLLSRITRIY